MAAIASIPPRSDPAEYTRHVVRSATAHPDPDRFGLDLKGWVGTGAIGCEFGPAMLAAMEEGTRVSNVYRNAASGGVGAGFCPRPAGHPGSITRRGCPGASAGSRCEDHAHRTATASRGSTLLSTKVVLRQSTTSSVQDRASPASTSATPLSRRSREPTGAPSRPADPGARRYGDLEDM